MASEASSDLLKLGAFQGGKEIHNLGFRLSLDISTCVTWISYKMNLQVWLTKFDTIREYDRNPKRFLRV